MRKLLLIIFMLISIWAFSQERIIEDVYEISIPRNLEQCFPILDKTLTDNELYVIKTYNEDSIYFQDEFRSGADFFHAWKLYEGSRLTKYFNKIGITDSHDIYETILVSYHRYLNNKQIDLEQQVKKYQEKHEKELKEYNEKIKKDSLNGNYIPKNLEDCFLTLNKVLKQEDIDEIKKLPTNDQTIKYHHSLGLWIRNNWGLWSGSRLQKYLLDKGLGHPDSMSSLILEYYHDWLNGENTEWKEFENDKKRMPNK